MTQDQVKILCYLFNLGEPKDFSRIYGGLLHKMWQLNTSKGSFAIKQLSKNIDLNEHTRKLYELTELIAGQFAAHGIPAIFSMTHNGMSLVDAGDDTFIVYSWINAKTKGQDKITVELAIKIAMIIATMHSLNLIIPEISKQDYALHSADKIARLINKSQELSLPFANELERTKQIILDINKKYHQSISVLDIDLVISHGDLDQKNVLWDETNNPLLIDWESSLLINPTYEILNAALDWSGVTTCSINNEIFIAMIKSYNSSGSSIKLDSLNKIFYCIQGNWINWLVFNIERSLKHSSDIEEMNISKGQVIQTLKTILYLNNKIENLIDIVKHNTKS